MVCLLENGTALRMARRLDGGGALTVERGTAEARLGLPRPNHLTLLEEWLAEAGLAPGAAPHRAGIARERGRVDGRVDTSHDPGARDARRPLPGGGPWSTSIASNRS